VHGSTSDAVGEGKASVPRVSAVNCRRPGAFRRGEMSVVEECHEPQAADDVAEQRRTEEIARHRSPAETFHEHAPAVPLPGNAPEPAAIRAEGRVAPSRHRRRARTLLVRDKPVAQRTATVSRSPTSHGAVVEVSSPLSAGEDAGGGRLVRAAVADLRGGVS
jgi:hypothetical protein